MKGILILAAAGVAGISLSFAVVAAAPTIGGNVDINVKADNVINTAVASNSKAEVILGSFVSGSAGDYKSTVSVKTVTNTATSSGSCSQVVIGSVGHQEC